jgi:hypothetical protein
MWVERRLGVGRSPARVSRYSCTCRVKPTRLSVRLRQASRKANRIRCLRGVQRPLHLIPDHFPVHLHNRLARHLHHHIQYRLPDHLLALHLDHPPDHHHGSDLQLVLLKKSQVVLDHQYTGLNPLAGPTPPPLPHHLPNLLPPILILVHFHSEQAARHHRSLGYPRQAPAKPTQPQL